jgi:RimJ/RimL family protein N-acetyltransferase
MITFTQYLQGGKLSRNATTIKKPKDFIIHQIASDQTQKGATKKVLDEFVDYCKSKGAGNILLTVRAFNERARKFYERYGFKYDSDIQWNSKETGIIPGVIYRLQLEKIKSDKFFQF